MKSVLFLINASICIMAVVSASAIIETDLRHRFQAYPESTHNVIVSFEENVLPVIQEMEKMSFATLPEKRLALINALEHLTRRSQGPVQKVLRELDIEYLSFWICNCMLVSKANYELVHAISHMPGVVKIQKEPVTHIDYPLVQNQSNQNVTILRKGKGFTWGIDKIRANRVWPYFTGSGVVVAIIDTGVRHSHEALRSNWRQYYGWYDAHHGVFQPYDLHGHGTHVTGTIAGQRGIGVAPDAQWVACKAGDPTFLCPMFYAVRNGYGVDFEGLEHWKYALDAWQYAGIVPVASAGNSGPQCSSLSPGCEPSTVITVGSVDANDVLSRFSSVGPPKAEYGVIKPDIVAPGEEVLSCGHMNDQAYSSKSGTSMACPHVAGLIALMMEKNPYLTYKNIYGAIRKSAHRQNLNVKQRYDCGGVPDSVFANYVFGYGRIDALNAVNAV